MADINVTPLVDVMLVLLIIFMVTAPMLSMGIDAGTAQGSLLFTLGSDNTSQDVDDVIRVLPPIVQRLREMSPLYKKTSKSKTV